MAEATNLIFFVQKHFLWLVKTAHSFHTFDDQLAGSWKLLIELFLKNVILTKIHLSPLSR